MATANSIAYRAPKAGAKLRVIGAGLPRTASNSFCAAISELLDGPAFHTGVQWAGHGAPTGNILEVCSIAEKIVPDDKLSVGANAQRRAEAMNALKGLLHGYVCTADPPLSQLTPELMELFPDAVVIVSVREREGWITSVLDMVKIVLTPGQMGYLFYWMPVERHIPRLYTAFGNVWRWRYGIDLRDRDSAIHVWETHEKQLKDWVPEERLVFYNVKEGWGPLCAALGVEVPAGKEFPRLNDKESLERHFEGVAREAVKRWAIAGAVVVVTMGVGLRWAL